MLTRRPSTVKARSVGGAIVSGLRAATAEVNPTTDVDVFAAARARNDADPRRHLATFRWYDTDRTDFNYLVEDIWAGSPVDEGATDSMVAVLRTVLAAASEGYASRITTSDGSTTRIAQDRETARLDVQWGAPDVRALALIGRPDV